VAAEALGRIGNAMRLGRFAGKVSQENSLNWIVPGLLTASAEEHDRVLEHSIIYALIETDIPQGTVEGLYSSSPLEISATMIALDQMDNGGLKGDDVTPFLNSSEAAVKSASLWVATHHAEWADALAGYFRERLASKDLSAADTAELQEQLIAFSGSPGIQKMVSSRLESRETPVSIRPLLLRVIANSSFKEAPASWIQAVRSCLSGTDKMSLPGAVSAAKALAQVKIDPPDFSDLVLAIAHDPSNSIDLRLEALGALPKGVAAVDPPLLKLLSESMDPSKPVPTRVMASTILGKARLNDEQLLSVAEVAAKAGPLELTRLVGAFEQSTNEAVGLKLMAALKQSKSLSSLRPDLVKSTSAKYSVPVQQKASELLSALNVNAQKQAAHLDELLASMKNGDVRRGQAIFNSQKAACYSCHKLGYMGGEIGPDLTSIGQVRSERDLLESIVYPSASFVRSFEPMFVRTKSDEQINGLIRKESADEVVLVTGPNAEVRISRSDITEMRPGTISIMPAGLDEQLSRQELADLLAFLKATKWGPDVTRRAEAR
jgi:putative heme-binding domain-containing protein